MLFRAVLLLVALIAWTSPVVAQGGSPGGVVPAPSAAPKNNDIGFDEKIGEQVPLDLTFRDEDDKPITLGECIGNKPTILVMAYYRCTVNCNKVLTNLADAMREFPNDYNAGNQFNVVTISMDPKENGTYAKRVKELHVKEYGRPNADAGWRFLSGDKATIEKLTSAIGYRFEFDKVFKEYNHPNGLLVLSPQGKVMRYFYGLVFSGLFDVKEKGDGAMSLRLSLIEAADGKGGSMLDKLTLACFSWNRHDKKYSADVRKIMRLGGVLTMLAIAVGVTTAFVRERRRKARTAPPATPTEGTT